MRSLRYLITLAAALAPIACSSDPVKVTQGQLLLHFDTDAPLPAGPDERGSGLTPLFNRLRVDIYPPGATTPCDGCASDFSINSGLFSAGKVSIGVASKMHTPGYRARARLFKSEFADGSGQPNADSSIDVTVALAVVDTNTVIEQTVFLSTDDAGHPVGSLDAPTAPLDGPPQASRVNTWAGAQRTTCKGPAPTCAGPVPACAVCVPGGAYWMGNPNGLGFKPLGYVTQPRLVVLSPFYLKATEVTVADYRESGLKLPATSFWNGSSIGGSTQDYCTNTRLRGPNEKLPLNCVAPAAAVAYCTAQGGELPTEAQLEYVEGGLASDPFPWGHDEPTCDDAIFGRGGWGIFANSLAPCMPATPPGYPAEPRSGARDRLDLPGGSLFDLAGNLAEMTRDLWNRIDEPCWARPGIYRDPTCATESPADGALLVYRGGDWAEALQVMPSYVRSFMVPDQPNVQIGFRCAWKSP